MKYIIFLLSIIVLVSCAKEKKQDIVNNSVFLIFKGYNPKNYHTPGGLKDVNTNKVCYVDSIGNFIYFTPQVNIDTLHITTSAPFVEVGLRYRNFEWIYYSFIQGDSIIITLDDSDYPVLRTTNHPQNNPIYSINHHLHKECYSHLGLSASTCLGTDHFIMIANQIDYIRTMKWDNWIKDYCPIDTLYSKFCSYKQAYTDTIDFYKSNSLLTNEIHQRYQYWLRLKEHESERILNRDTAYYQCMEFDISDKYLIYPSYREYLYHYLYFFNKHVSDIKMKQGGDKDWKQTFDELASRQLSTKSKQILLKLCMENICNLFSAKEINSYLDKYLSITQDKELYNSIKEEYQLSSDAEQLLLKDIYGNSTNLNEILNRHKGKVIYIDFWASWCMPCKEEIPFISKLREKYKRRDIVFLYLAYKDTENAWRKALKEESLEKETNNFFIINSKNSKILEKIKLELIPRYIIFDKQGNIAEMNAPRPSNVKVTEILDKYLNE